MSGASATNIASAESIKAYVDSEITTLGGSAPAALNTLNELAAALNDDASFSTTVTNSIALKAPINNPTFTGTIAIPNISNIETAIANNTAKATNATHTGDVTGSGALTIGNDKVTYAKMQNVTNARMLGNNAGSDGDVTEMTKANVLTFLNVADGATADQTNVTGSSGSCTGNAATATSAGVVTTAAQPNITSLGSLTALDVNGAADISGDLTLSAGGDGALTFGGASSIKIIDNHVTALVIEEANNAYMTFKSSNSSELVKVHTHFSAPEVTFTGNFNLGANGSGVDSIFHGATSGRNATFDASGNTLALNGFTVTGTGTWQAGAITHAYIGADAIEGDNIADNAVNSEHYTDGSIDTDHIADDAVTYAKMQNLATANRVLGSTSTGVIGEVQIVEAMIANDAVTADKIANSINSAIAANTSKNTNVSTNLSATTHASQITLNSSDGNNVVVAQASGSIAGVMTVAHHDKLDGIETSATADQTKADIDGLAITTVGTLDTGNATAIVTDASTSAKGKASFSSDNFAVSSGAVTIKDGGVDLTAEVTGVLPSANLDADTAHLTTNQTFTGQKQINIRKFPVSSGTDGNAIGDVAYFGGTTSMTVGRIYHYKSDGTWELANADAIATSDGLLAVALGAASDTNGMLLRGMVTLDHDPGAVGDVLYVQSDNAGTTGHATATAPSATGDCVRIVGYCVHASAGNIWFNPDNTFVEHA